MAFFLQNVVNSLQLGSFYALIALGYSMVYGVLMLFNFAHGDIFMVGGYLGFFVASALVAFSALGGNTGLFGRDAIGGPAARTSNNLGIALVHGLPLINARCLKFQINTDFFPNKIISKAGK